VPQHGCRLQDACPGCQRRITTDGCLPAALTCGCGHRLSDWTPQTDAILAEQRFPKLEAFGHALRTHAALQGRAERTFVLGPYPERVSQESVLVLWTQANRPNASEIKNVPSRIRPFSTERLVAEDLSGLAKEPYPLSQLYWSINRSLLRRIGRRGTTSRRLAAFEYWELFWICTRGRLQMLCPGNISTERHELRLREILFGWAAWPYRDDPTLQAALPTLLLVLLTMTFQESWRQVRSEPTHYINLDDATVLPILFVDPFCDGRPWVASTHWIQTAAWAARHQGSN
jgi:hypothetical protein